MPEDNRICYVGRYDELMGQVPFSMALCCSHPSEFPSILTSIEQPIWSNNPLVVDCFPVDRIICIHGDKSARLDQHPDFERWKDEFSNGEFWTFVGEKWVEKINQEQS